MVDEKDEWADFNAKLDLMLDSYLGVAKNLASLGLSREPSRGEAEAKAEEFREAIRNNPGDANAFKMLAIALAVCGRREEARWALLKATQLRYGNR